MEYIPAPIPELEESEDIMNKVEEYQSAPDIRTLCEDLLQLSNKDYRLARKLARRIRRLDRMQAKMSQDLGCIGRLQELSDKEFTQALKSSKALRRAYEAMERAERTQALANKSRLSEIA